jgi:alkylhydroperoxidase family enzyme
VLGSQTVAAVLADWRTAPVDERVRAALGLLEKLNRAPAEVGPEDVAPLRTAGLSEQAIADAIYVCGLFNMIDRVADALGFKIPTPEEFARGARMLLRLGYRMF